MHFQLHVMDSMLWNSLCKLLRGYFQLHVMDSLSLRLGTLDLCIFQLHVMDSGFAAVAVLKGGMYFQLHVMDSGAGVGKHYKTIAVALSTPCNGFPSTTVRAGRKAFLPLSTPCNGFDPPRFSRGGNRRDLSTPCNGFSILSATILGAPRG